VTAFKDAYQRLDARIKLFVSLPMEKLDRLMLKREADRIGRIGPDSAARTAS
jgi:hypothetical protein